MPVQNDISIKLYKSIKSSNVERKMEMWHASSLSSCPRNQYFKRLGIAPLSEPSAPLVIRWGAGHLLETMIRPHIEAVYGKAATNERMTSKALSLTGEFDNYIPSVKRLVEIKSVHDSAFIDRDGHTYLKDHTGTKTAKTGRVTNTWGIKDTPYLHHELQNHCYVLLLREQGIEVEGIDYVYISLSGRIVVYSTDVQQDKLDNVNARLKALNEAWEAQTPPDCICLEAHPLYAGVMRYCDYRDEETCCSLELLNKGEK